MLPNVTHSLPQAKPSILVASLKSHCSVCSLIGAAFQKVKLFKCQAALAHIIHGQRLVQLMPFRPRYCKVIVQEMSSKQILFMQLGHQ